MRRHLEHLAVRDGIHLVTDVWQVTPEPAPLALVRTPYRRDNERLLHQRDALLRHGFHVAIQSVRGRHGSEGQWEPWVNERRDGFDTIEALSQHRLCDGRVVTFGGSYEGWCQWAAAADGPPSLAAMAPRCSGGAWASEMPYRNGLFAVSLIEWLRQCLLEDQGSHATLELEATRQRQLTRLLDLWLAHPPNDPYWHALTLTSKDYQSINVPVLTITGWFDENRVGALTHYNGMLAAGNGRQTLLIGPWDHRGTLTPTRYLSGVDFGPLSTPRVGEMQATWLRRQVAPVSSEQPAANSRTTVFVTGTNTWHCSSSWPPPTDPLRIELSDNRGRLASILSAQAPVPDMSGRQRCAHTSYLDRSGLVEDPRVASFATDPLEHAVEVAGSCLVVGPVGSGNAACLVVLLCEIMSLGAFRFLSDGACQTIGSAGGADDEPLQVRLDPVHHTFVPGTRIGLLLSSGDSPRFLPYATGFSAADVLRGRTPGGRVVASRSGLRPSTWHLILPQARRPGSALQPTIRLWGLVL